VNVSLRRTPSACVVRRQRRDRAREIVGLGRVNSGEAADLAQAVVDGVGVHVQIRRGLTAVAAVGEVAAQCREQVGATGERLQQYGEAIARRTRAAELVLEGLVPSSVAAPLHPSALGMAAFGGIAAQAAR
jgi:putative heme degradation protein